MEPLQALYLNNHLPDIWGEGILFAYSGLEGTTDSAAQFVATSGSGIGQFLFHTPIRRRLNISIPRTGHVRVITGDTFVADWEEGHVILTYAEWHTLVGMAPKHLLISVEKELNGDGVSPDVSMLGSNPEHGSEVVFLRRPDGQFSLSYGRTMEEAGNRAQQGLEVNVRQTAERHLRAYDLLPELPANQVEQRSGRLRLLNKCYSIMRVNTLSNEGAIQQRWSTPDRVPHRYMWLWDSAFHSFGMNDAQPDAAWDFLRSMLEMRQEDGMIPITAVWTGEFVSVTQPPLLAWAVWNNYLRNKRRDNLAYALPILEKYLAWDLANRDDNENGLLEWKIELDTYCRSGE